ncbi:hypothetical protein NFI96_027522 [Prochilodus magdalenae]|nr:hypothetical protein NFI96_027522 [Prochilodus magdalenae]
MMSTGNGTFVKDFFIVGFPGLHPNYHGFISAAMLLVYLCTLMGNGLFVFLFGTEKGLRKPVYYIFISLVVSDVLFSTSTLPKIIARYWFQAGSISFLACFIQMYLVHYSGTVNSFILALMAIDRYVAVCFPLQYHTVMTNRNVFLLSLAAWVLSHATVLSMAIRAYPLPYCGLNTILHCYCDHISVTRLACTDRTPYSFPAFVSAMIVLVGSLAIIVLSYCCIIVEVLKVSSAGGRLKTFSTCSSQLIIIALFFIPRLFNYLAANIGFTFNADLQIAIVMLYSLLPPMINPLIYCLRTQEVKKILIRRLQRNQQHQPMMSTGNGTFVKDFFIFGFPGLHPSYHGLASAAMLLVYICILMGNGLFVFLFGTEKGLRKPVYHIFISLVVSDVLFSTSTLPKIIARYWFQAGSISFLACFIQMYLVHYSGTVNSFILALMAIDRYVAVCYPLQYHTVMTNRNVFLLSLVAWVLSHATVLSMAIRAYPLPYCGPNAILHCYCDHISVTRLACTDRTPYSFPAFVSAMIVLVGSLAIIVFSYCCIIVEVLKVSSAGGRLKTFSTCSSQLIIIALFFIPRCFNYFTAYAGITFNADLQIAIVMLYSLLPPMINPLIYCLRTQEVKKILMRRSETWCKLSMPKRPGGKKGGTATLGELLGE